MVEANPPVREETVSEVLGQLPCAPSAIRPRILSVVNLRRCQSLPQTCGGRTRSSPFSIKSLSFQRALVPVGADIFQRDEMYLVPTPRCSQGRPAEQGVLGGYTTLEAQYEIDVLQA